MHVACQLVAMQVLLRQCGTIAHAPSKLSFMLLLVFFSAPAFWFCTFLQYCAHCTTQYGAEELRESVSLQLYFHLGVGAVGRLLHVPPTRPTVAFGPRVALVHPDPQQAATQQSPPSGWLTRSSKILLFVIIIAIVHARPKWPSTHANLHPNLSSPMVSANKTSNLPPSPPTTATTTN